MKQVFKIGILVLLLPSLIQYAAASSSPSPALPNPLTLDYVLNIENLRTPNILSAEAEFKRSQALFERDMNQNNMEAFVDIDISGVKPATESVYANDSYGRLVLSKTISDFGQSKWRERSSKDWVQFKALQMSHTIQQDKFQLLEYFFDILLSDANYVYANEAMTVDYLVYDKLKERHSLGLTDDLALLEAENKYHLSRTQRVAADNHRFLSRKIFSDHLGNVTDLPKNVKIPKLSFKLDNIASLQSLIALAKKQNIKLESYSFALRYAQKNRHLSKSKFQPTLQAHFEAGKYYRELKGRNEIRSGFLLKLPLLDKGLNRYQRELNAVEIQHYQAKIREHTLDIQKNLSQLHTSLSILNTQSQQIDTLDQWSDLNLDKNRALYDMEFQASMSTSMAHVTKSDWLKLKNKVETALALARINLILNQPLLQSIDKSQVKFIKVISEK